MIRATLHTCLSHAVSWKKWWLFITWLEEKSGQASGQNAVQRGCGQELSCMWKTDGWVGGKSETRDTSRASRSPTAQPGQHEGKTAQESRNTGSDPDTCHTLCSLLGHSLRSTPLSGLLHVPLPCCLQSRPKGKTFTLETGCQKF